MRTFLLLLIGVVIGAFGLYAYQDPGVRYDVSQFIKGIGDLAFEDDAPTPTTASLAVAAPSPTATIPATNTPAPTATQTQIPTPSATSVPNPIPIPTATAVRVLVPTPRPAAHSIEVASAKSLGDGQVDFVLNVENVGGLATERAAEVRMSVDGGPPELVNIIDSLSPGESSSFAFIRALDPGRRVLTFMVGDFAMTVSVNIEAEDVALFALAPTATITPTLVPTYTPTRTPTPAPTYTPVPTPAPVSPTPRPSPTTISGDSQNEFFKSLKDLARESSLSQPDIEIEELESLVHSLINQERVKQGLAALQWDEEIVAIARSHSQDMADKNYFSHVNLEGQNATDRGSSAGYDCVKVYGSYYTFGLAENIHQGWLFSSTTYINGVARHNWNSQAEISEAAVNGWMRSQGHRKNILNDAYDRTGIGIAIAPDGKVFITQNFC